MTNKINSSLLAVVLTFAGFASAQTSSTAATQPVGPGVYDADHPRVNQVDNRLENQKDRIQQGVKKGTLTPEQARQLARNDRRIANQERRDMAGNGGHLTKQEQRQLNRELNQNSKKIYKEKHD